MCRAITLQQKAKNKWPRISILSLLILLVVVFCTRAVCRPDDVLENCQSFEMSPKGNQILCSYGTVDLYPGYTTYLVRRTDKKAEQTLEIPVGFPGRCYWSAEGRYILCAATVSHHVWVNIYDAESWDYICYVGGFPKDFDCLPLPLSNNKWLHWNGTDSADGWKVTNSPE